MKKKKVLRFVCFSLVLCMMMTMLTGCFSREETITVEKISWSYNIQIEKEVLCEESDWTLPENATLIEQRRERYKRRYDSDGNYIGWQYKTKYYYEIMRWKYERDVTTSEEDNTPYYGEPNLAANERVSRKTEEYFVHGVNQDGESVVYSIDYDEWIKIGPGDTLVAKVSIFKKISEIISHEKSIEKFN